ncbi:MAG: hypothetical protein M3480_05150 [Verrucomicrobiota bacterium]|nr:hypothetical protein [Verrucomicrobiota bacterium]
MELQIAYVLFVDIVGYSKLLLNEQRRLRGLLNEMVRGTEQFRTAEEKGRLIKPSPRRWNGAGVYQSREAPVECARISNATAKNGAAARDRWLVAESFRPCSGSGAKFSSCCWLCSAFGGNRSPRARHHVGDANRRRRHGGDRARRVRDNRFRNRVDDPRKQKWLQHDRDRIRFARGTRPGTGRPGEEEAKEKHDSPRIPRQSHSFLSAGPAQAPSA